MDILKANTVRFSQVVQKCGTPELLTLWQAPDKDPHFSRALRENRVMTIVQEPAGTKKDFGVVGYLKKRNVSFLIFPKSLADFASKRIVGLKYDWIVPSKPRGKQVRLGKATAKPGREPKNIPAKVAQFHVNIRCTAEIFLHEQIEAANKTTARKQALALIAERKIDFSQATVSAQVIKIKKL